MASAHPGREGLATLLVLRFRKRLDALVLRLSRLTEDVTHTLQSHIITGEIETQREVGVGGPQVPVHQVVDGGFHLDGIILTNLGAHS